MTKTATFTMGLPAAGKSTWIANNLGGVAIVDPDAIKAAHPDYDPKRPELLHSWSKQRADARFAALLAGDSDFVVDGTGTNAENLISKIRRAASAGFNTSLVFVVVSLQTSIARNSNRLRVVPESVVREKFETISLAFELVSREVDQIRVINND
jgi:predicted ABC-type ATPase